MRAAQDEANEYYSEDNIGVERRSTVLYMSDRRAKDLCFSSLGWQLAVHFGHILPPTIVSTSWLEQDAR